MAKSISSLSAESLRMSVPHTNLETFGKDCRGILRRFGMTQNAASKFPEKQSQLLDMGDGTYLLQNTQTRFSYHAKTFEDAVKTLQGGTTIKQDRLDLRNAKMTAAKGFFPAYDPNVSHSTPIVSWDIETGDNGQILSIAGIKVAMNKVTGKFEYIDEYNRVFSPASKNYNTEPIHGLTAPIIHKFQRWIGKGKTSFFDQDEVRAFQAGAKNLTHNGSAFDNPKLFPGFWDSPSNRLSLTPEGYIDTLMLGEAEWGIGKGRNTLDAQFKQLYHKSPESFGLTHHLANADAIMTVFNLQGMYHSKTRAGMLARALVNNSGYASNWQDLGMNKAGYISELVGKGGSMPYSGTGIMDLSEVGAEAIFDSEGGLRDGINVENLLSSHEQEGWGDSGSPASFTELAEAIKLLAASNRNGNGLDAHSYQGLRYRKALGKDLAHLVNRNGKPLTGKRLRAFYDALKTKTASDSISDAFADVIYKEAVGAAQENFIAENKPYWRKQQSYLIKDRAKYAGTDFFSTLQNETEPTLASIANYEVAREQFDRQLKDEQAERTARIEQQRAEEQIHAEARGHAQYLDVMDSYKELKQGWDIKDAKQALVGDHTFSELQQFTNSLNSQKQGFSRIASRYKDVLPQGMIEGIADASNSTREFKNELDKAAKVVNTTAAVFNSLNQGKWADPMQTLGLIGKETNAVMSTAKGILPSWIEKPAFRLTNSFGNLWGEGMAKAKRDIGNTADTLGMVGGALGAAAGSVFGPMGAAAGFGMGQGLLKFGSRVFQRNTEADISNFSEAIQHRINLVGFTVDALLAPLRAFGSGLKLSVNLFGKLANLWSYMPSYTLSNLTGLDWGTATKLGSADRLMGFKEGTMNSMYNDLSYQQSDLYLSGKFNEERLVAAARLGIFDRAYAAMGGKAEEQQASIINEFVARLKAAPNQYERHSLLGLIKQYDPNMVNIVERMEGMGINDYNVFKNGLGWRTLKGENGESSRVARTSWDFDMSRRSLTEGLAKAGDYLWQPVGRPIMEMLNKIVWDFADGNGIDWQGIKEKLKAMWVKISDMFSLGDLGFSIDLKGIADKLADGFEYVFDWLGGKLGDFINKFIAKMADTRLEGFDITKMLMNLFVHHKSAFDGMDVRVTSGRDIMKEFSEGFRLPTKSEIDKEVEFENWSNPDLNIYDPKLRDDAARTIIWQKYADAQKKVQGDNFDLKTAALSFWSNIDMINERVGRELFSREEAAEFLEQQIGAKRFLHTGGQAGGAVIRNAVESAGKVEFTFKGIANELESIKNDLTDKISVKQTGDDLTVTVYGGY